MYIGHMDIRNETDSEIVIILSPNFGTFSMADEIQLINSKKTKQK